MCAHRCSSRSAGGRHCVLESQQESVCPSILSQTSTNQQKQMGVCSAGPGDSGKYGGASAPRAFFFFYLLKEALTGAHTILGNVFPSISSLSALVSPHSFLPFSSFSSLSRAPPPALASPPPSCRYLLFLAPSHPSHSLNSHLHVLFFRRRTPLTV